jgi:hypothetical protein
MNDNELMTVVRESFSDVHSATSATRIITRGRTVRARRRIPALSAALAVMAAAALGATTLASSGTHGGHQPGAQLTAWTVTKQADGDISVTIRQWIDPAGLQRQLRADGLPVEVTPPANPSCRPREASKSLLEAIVSVAVHPGSGPGFVSVNGEPVIFVIHPSAIPSGAGLALSAPHPRPSFQVVNGPLLFPISLVHASHQCTGS